jgi:nitrogen fixation protein FixH
MSRGSNVRSHSSLRFSDMRQLLLPVVLLASTFCSAAISFVQGNSAVPQSSQTTVAVAYTAAQVAGDTNVVAVGWSDITSSVVSVTDSKNNVYTLAIGPTRQSAGQSQSIYVAKNVVAAAANANSVTVTFNAAANFADVRILSYRGLDTVSPVEAAVGAGGSGTSSNSGSLTTTNANDLLFAANCVSSTTNSAGSGFTNRGITSPDGDISEDRIVTAAGSYSATASIGSGAWVMQLVALKAAGSQPVAATPTFSPLPGTYTSTQSVSLQDTTAGAAIHYTTDGVTNPTASSPVFNPATPIQVSANTTIKAMAVASGFANSAVATGAYTIQIPVAATPTFSPLPGTYTSTQSVSLSDTTSGATIYYTTDGVTNPTTSSPVFNPATPIQVSANTTIKAMAAASGFTNSAVATGAYTIQQPTAATPTFSPLPGTYTSTQSVSLQDTTSGATIYYTTDGVTNPTTSSTVYNPATPIQVSANTTIKAMAAASGFTNSAVATGAYTIQQPIAATPTFSPLPGTYTSTQSVSLQDTTSGATIYYTTDGVTTPTTSSPVYNPAAPIQVSANMTIKAMATASGFTNSAVATGAYVIQPPTAATPTFSPLPGTYTSTQSVSLSDTTSGATIYYTTDGVTNPTTSSTVYNPATPIQVSANMTIKAMAAASGFTNSAVATGAYTIQIPTAATPTFSPLPGTYTSTQSVSLQDTTSGATIYYTTDGVTTPTTSSPVFNPATPIQVSANTTIKAMAAASGFTNSAVATGAYSIGAPAPISFVQVASATPQSPQTTVAVAYTAAQTAGDTNVVVVGWSDATSTVSSVMDSKGNIYSPAIGPTRQSGIQSQSIYVAPNIAAATAGANSVTVTFSAAAPFPDIRILEYRGVSPTTPLDGAVGAIGTGTTSSSGPLTTTNANDLLFAANTEDAITTGPGTGFTSRIISPQDANIAEDEVVTATGTYTGTAAMSSGNWVMQMIALKGAGSQLAAAATPTFSPLPGTYTSAQSVSLSDTTSGATIYYTTDGVTNPTTSSTAYNPATPIQVSANMTIKAMAAASGFANSAVATGAYTIQTPTAATPTFSPVPGTYTSTQSVSLSDTTSGATIYYTTDGVTNPTTSSPVFNPATPIQVSANTTIKAMAAASGFANSAVATGAYTIQQPTAATPTFSPLPGTYTSTQSVSLQDTTSGATIYYTTDGVTTPTTSSTVYNPATPIQVSANMTIKAMAAASGFTNSAVATGAYVIQPPTAATPTFSPLPGTYTSTQSVSLQDTTSGATIYYTTDGVTNPTTSSTVYNPATPIQVSANMTIKAMAAASGFTNSAVATGSYTIGAPAPISFVQVASATPQSPQSTVAVAYATAQTAGDTNVVVVGWSDATSTITSVTDTKNDTYSLAIGPTRQSGVQSQSIYVAPNIAGATAGANSVTVTFSAAVAFPDIRILEYRGLSPTTPLDGAVGAIGTGTTSSSGPLTTTSANDLLFAANTEDSTTTGPGAGFTSRIITPTDANIAEDEVVTATGTYTGTAAMSSGNWVMQMIALRAASQIVDTTPPTTPTNLVANAAAGNQINLGWTASTDNVGVTAYLIERCQGSGCTNFAQINTSPTNSYSDTGLSSSTTYIYRVRATDAAGNLSGYSNPPASATTGFSITPASVTLTFNQTQQFSGATGSVTWLVDNIVGGSSSVGTISNSGLYTAPASVGSHTVTANASAGTANATVNVTNYPGTFTRDVDKLRTGLNPNETVLTPTNVNSTRFGKLFSYSIDGTSDASPLYVPSVAISGQGVHNVVYVATEHDSVYAFDADGLQTNPLWHDSFVNGSSVTVVPPGDTGECCDISPEIGITGSPVIDPATNTLYVVVKTKETGGGNTNYFHRLHALDLGSGAEKFGGPVDITATSSGNGAGSSGGQIVFDNLHQNQRAALLLNNGVVYIAFGAHGDNSPYHGWILGYNASSLQRVMSFNTSPNDNGIRSTGGGQGSGVWQSGDGIATDSTGNLYYVTGNGVFDVNSGGPDYGDSLMKLSTSGTVLDYFTPHDQQMMNDQDLDLGSGGVLLLPDQSGAHPHLAITAGKNGTIYVVDRDNMGHYNSNSDNVVQTIVNIFPNGNKNTGNFKAAVYWNGHLFYSPDADNIKSFSISNGTIMSSPTSQSSFVANYPGATLQVSANGNTNGILWAIQRIDQDPSGNGTRGPGVLHAFDATNLGNELYNSTQASGGRDALDFVCKWSAPLIANGKVYVASETRVTGFGLLP